MLTGVYVFIDEFAPSLTAYALHNVLIRVVPKPFPTTSTQWADNKRLIVQDEYLPPWAMPSFRRLWRHNARQALDDFLLETLRRCAAHPTFLTMFQNTRAQAYADLLLCIAACATKVTRPTKSTSSLKNN